MKKYEKWYDAGSDEKSPVTWKAHFDESLHREHTIARGDAVCNDRIVCDRIKSKDPGMIAGNHAS